MRWSSIRKENTVAVVSGGDEHYLWCAFYDLLAVNYEYHLHHPCNPRSYMRFQHTRNQSLGFGALLCFCISYMWLIAAATR